MNREIKFRAWSGTKMFYSFTMFNGTVWDSIQDKPIDWPVMQYTGLKDKNGKDIYEGDIVRWGLGFTGSYDEEPRHRYALVDINPDLQFKIIYYVDSETLEKKPSDKYVFRFGNFAYKETHLYLEVIGNIYENPDLIPTIS